MICGKTKLKLLIYYRIFRDYFGIPIESVSDLRKIVHQINLKSVEFHLCLTIWEHPIMIDESVFESVLEEYRKDPVRIGKMPETESDEWDWDVWEHTSVMDRKWFLEIANDYNNWRDIGDHEIITYDYKKNMDSDQSAYHEETRDNHFIFEYELRNNPYKEYMEEEESRIKSYFRDWKLEKLL